MKVTKFKDEITQLNKQELQEKLDSLRREQFGMRLNAVTAPVKDYSQFKKLKKNIARIITHMRSTKNKA